MDTKYDHQPINEPLCLLIGNFDGVHLGHQAIIRQAKEIAARSDLKTAVLSFDPHPLKLLAPDKAPKLLQSLNEKQMLLEHYGLDFLILRNFDQAFSQLSPQDFLDELCQQLDLKELLVGFNFRFGHQRQGDVALLKTLASERNINVHIIEDTQKDHATISSSRIRRLVGEGRLVEASQLLGRPYFFSGQVVHGQEIGRKLNSPTANLQVKNEQLPRYGVYAGWVRLASNQWYRTITNIGVAPTLKRGYPLIETHLFDFTGSLYEQELLLCPSTFIREERTFENQDQLRAQIAEDIKTRLAMNDYTPPKFELF